MVSQDREERRGTQTILIALGANAISAVGEPAETLRKALWCLEGEGLKVLKCSAFYSSPAFPPGAGPDFVNAVLTAETCLSASEVLALLHAVEAQFGRQRLNRWGPRTLDLDLLAMDSLVMPDVQTLTDWIALSPEEQRIAVPDQLILPHPRLQDRAFVLVPLAEVAPDWRHPLSGLSVARMLAELPQAERDAVKPL